MHCACQSVRCHAQCILSDRSTTRAKIQANIQKAKAYAAKTGKPLFNSEIGCIARANPYDVTRNASYQIGAQREPRFRPISKRQKRTLPKQASPCSIAR